MSLINYATKEITLKIVYYGPALSGKTTNLQYLHSVLDPAHTGKLVSLATEADRTLFFDFLPIELGMMKDFSVRFQVYTVPGQIRYNATRKLVLRGADAVVFVGDSQKELLKENIESLNNMRENLTVNNLKPDEIPLVMQYNKRDLKNILSVHELNTHLNIKGYDFLESVAVKGTGVYETLQKISTLLIKDFSKKHKINLISRDEGRREETKKEEPKKEKIKREEPRREEVKREEVKREEVKREHEYAAPEETTTTTFESEPVAADFTADDNEAFDTLTEEEVTVGSSSSNYEGYSATEDSLTSESLEYIYRDIIEMKSSIGEMKRSLTNLVPDLQAKVVNTQQTAKSDSLIIENTEKIDKLLKEIQISNKYQIELLSHVKDLKNSLHAMQTKRKFFKFFF